MMRRLVLVTLLFASSPAFAQIYGPGQRGATGATGTGLTATTCPPVTTCASPNNGQISVCADTTGTYALTSVSLTYRCDGHNWNIVPSADIGLFINLPDGGFPDPAVCPANITDGGAASAILYAVNGNGEIVLWQCADGALTLAGAIPSGTPTADSIPMGDGQGFAPVPVTGDGTLTLDAGSAVLTLSGQASTIANNDLNGAITIDDSATAYFHGFQGTWQAQATSATPLARQVDWGGPLHSLVFHGTIRGVACSWLTPGTAVTGTGHALIRVYDVTKSQLMCYCDFGDGSCQVAASTIETCDCNSGGITASDTLVLQWASIGGGNDCTAEPASAACTMELYAP